MIVSSSDLPLQLIAFYGSSLPPIDTAIPRDSRSLPPHQEKTPPMPPHLEITIPQTTTSTTNPTTTYYTIILSTPLRKSTLQKRYSDFPPLHGALTAQHPNDTPPPAQLPPKSWSLFKSTSTSPELVEQRRRGLETYLQAVQSSPDARWRETAAWRAFLQLPSVPSSNNASTSANGGKNANRSANGTTPKIDVIIDPSVWLDIHRDAKSALRSARLATTARDQAATAQAQHEAAAEAKKCLVRASTMIATLDAGLSSLSGGKDGSDTARRKLAGDDDDRETRGPRLGDGEIRRRRDLLASARKEMDGIETALAATSTRISSTGAETAAAPAGARAQLLSHPSSRSSRVLGARTPVPETDKTRELDNVGVLQLQQQVMAAQDEDVSELTRTVGRMREMGVRIGEEVGAQNEMLGMLEDDVGRVGDKVRVARERVGKIK